MKLSRFALVLLVAISLPVILGLRCSDSDELLSADPEEFTVNVDLIGDMDSGMCIHLFAPGENFPCCRVCGEGARSTVMTIKQGSSYVFRAGRNGAIVSQRTCFAPEDAQASDNFSVEYFETAEDGGDVLFSCGSGWEFN